MNIFQGTIKCIVFKSYESHILIESTMTFQKSSTYDSQIVIRKRNGWLSKEVSSRYELERSYLIFVDFFQGGLNSLFTRMVFNLFQASLLHKRHS